MSSKVQNVDLASIWFINRTDKVDRRHPATYEFGDKTSRKVTTAVTHGTTHQFGVAVTLSVESGLTVPFLGTVKATTSIETRYTLTSTYEITLTTEQERSMHWTSKGPISPKSALYCKAYTFRGQYDDEYEATVVIGFKNGKKIEVKQPGRFVSVGWTEAIADCTPKLPQDAPPVAIDLTPGVKGNRAMLKARGIGAYY